MPTKHHRAHRPLWLTLLAGSAVAVAAAGLFACNNTTGGGGISGQTLDKAPADRSPDEPIDLAAQIQSDVDAVRALMASKDQAPVSSPQVTYQVDPTPASAPPERPAPIVSAAEPTAANIGTSVSIEEPAAHTSAPEMAVDVTDTERVSRSADDLASALRKRAETETAPFGTLVALGALDLVTPGLGAPGTTTGSLTSAEDRALAAWRSALSQASSELTSGSGPETIERLAKGLLDTLNTDRSLDVARFALCTRVDGFGQFEEFATTSFLARRRHQAIVYVEVDRFTSAPASDTLGTAGFEVALVQGVSLYHADGTLAWRQTDQETIDFSRNQRRDFFVVQRIELPETLTVGSYNLKVTMRDKATGAIAERTLPITIVADAALTRPESQPAR